MRNINNNTRDAAADLSPEGFAHFGDGRLAYVKSVKSEDVQALFPQAQVPGHFRLTFPAPVVVA